MSYVEMFQQQARQRVCMMLSTAMSNRFEIFVEGIEDAAVVAAIDTAIRDCFLEMALPGAWRVTVRPSPVRGRWNFTIHGLDVRHVLSIAVPPSLLPSLIPRRLQESLDRVVGGHVESARRPTHELLRAV
jgi:hypothetical protein